MKLKKKSLFRERFRTLFNFHRTEKIKLVNNRLDRYAKKKYKAKRRKFSENLNVDGNVLVLAEIIRKKLASGKFYKQSVQNISYFNKEKTFSIRKKQKIDKIDYYWLTNLQSNRKLTKRFQRTELFAINNNFII